MTALGIVVDARSVSWQKIEVRHLEAKTNQDSLSYVKRLTSPRICILVSTWPQNLYQLQKEGHVIMYFACSQRSERVSDTAFYSINSCEDIWSHHCRKCYQLALSWFQPGQWEMIQSPGTRIKAYSKSSSTSQSAPSCRTPLLMGDAPRPIIKHSELVGVSTLWHADI